MVTQINDTFLCHDVAGPIVTARYGGFSEAEQLKIQKKIVALLHQVNYFRAYWSAYHNQFFFRIPLRLVSKRDWQRNQAWFSGTVWPWIRKDKHLRESIGHLFDRGDFQEDKFVAFFEDFIQKLMLKDALLQKEENGSK